METQCQHFPCHQGISVQEYRCNFCMCPLYDHPDCGGDVTILQNGIKDCSHCIRPHTKAGQESILMELKKWKFS